MSEFSKHYSGHDFQALNIYRQFKKVIHLSCITLSDGSTIDKECLDAKEGKSVAHKFPLQHPSRALRTLWSNAIMHISSDYLVLSDALGQYIRPPHRPHKWTSNKEGSIAHYQVVRDGIQRYIIYTISEERKTRSGRRMRRMQNFSANPLPYYASIFQVDEDTVILHSWVKGYQSPPAPTSSFLNNIHNDSNPSLWKTLKCDGDGSWIIQGLLTGTLLVSHDGSYMKDVATDICSAAVMIYCTRSAMKYTCTIAEISPSASSYRGEILGAILTQLIFRAASTGTMGPFPRFNEL
jgi:hypothetical protein